MFIVRTKKQLVSSALMIFLGICFGAVLRFSYILDTFRADKEDIKTIIVDAGHGMPDGGTVGYSGTIEQEINLKISKKTKEVLEGKGYRVILTREDEDSLAKSEDETIRKMKVEDMHLRKKIMEESDADLFISIHMNSYPDKSVSGLRFFYSANHPEIKGLAELMQKDISNITGAKAYTIKAADKDLFLMKNPPIPAILAECGFLTNPEEEKKLREQKYQEKIAWAIGEALDEYYKK